MLDLGNYANGRAGADGANEYCSTRLFLYWSDEQGCGEVGDLIVVCNRGYVQTGVWVPEPGVPGTYSSLSGKQPTWRNNPLHLPILTQLVLDESRP